MAREQAENELQLLPARVKSRSVGHRFRNGSLPSEFEQESALSVQQVRQLLDQADALLMLVVGGHGGYPFQPGLNSGYIGDHSALGGIGWRGDRLHRGVARTARKVDPDGSVAYSEVIRGL